VLGLLWRIIKSVLRFVFTIGIVLLLIYIMLNVLR
jgi:hypothetical protein